MITKDIEYVLLEGSIPELLELYRQRKLSVTEAVNWYLTRIKSISQSGLTINAVREISPHAMEHAEWADKAIASGQVLGALHGIPVLLKDNILTNDGMRAAAGAAALGHFIPTLEATLVAKLRAAGAIILGKTNLTEFADFVSDVMPSGYSGNGGVVKNPHGIEYGRGQGSSVGSAASVAASLCMFAMGSETQNSIQTPASYSSVVGYKPSVGLVSRAGVIPLVPSQDSPGPLTRSVSDAALVGSVLAGADIRDTATLLVNGHLSESFVPKDLVSINIGVPRRQISSRPEFIDLMPLFNEVLEKLSRAGMKIVDPCDLPSADELQEVRSSVFRTEFKAALNAFLEDNNSPCGISSMADLIQWNENHPEHIPYGQSLLIASNATLGLDDPSYQADRAQDIQLSRTSGIDAVLKKYEVDILLAPMGSAAKLTGKAGVPVVAIPCGLSSNALPFGITVFSSLGSDARLLAIAKKIEGIVGERIVPK